jgi:hypothetical protein
VNAHQLTIEQVLKTVRYFTAQNSGLRIGTSIIQGCHAENRNLVDDSVGSALGVDELASHRTGLRLMSKEPYDLDEEIQFSAFRPCFFSSFAHVSFNAIVRLNTRLPGFESGSTQKYPRRSN